MNAESQLKTDTPSGLDQKRKRHILFVDDEPLIARLAEQFLARLGYTSAVHTQPLDALASFHEGDFDLVITDLSMPGMSGLELGKQLRQIRPGQPIILTSAYHSMLEGKDVRAMGFTDFLPKPYNAEALRAAIEKVFVDPSRED